MFYSFSRMIGVLSVVLAGATGAVYAADALSGSMEPAALNAAGIRTLQQTDPNLNGSGIVIAAVCRSMTYLDGRPQNDYRFNMRHHSLINADVLFEDRSDGGHGISPHATAIAGVLIGLDPQSAFPDGTPFGYQGVSPYASVDVYEFWRFAALWLFARKPIPADVITLSLGDMFEDWWTRGLEQVAAEKGTVIVAAIGNGLAARDPVLYPAAGANVIGVGVMDSVLDENGVPSLDRFALPTARHSSGGPTDDLRSKPDLVAPGTALIPDAYTEYGYTTLSNATSLAAPLTAGTAALLLQKAQQDETLHAALSDTPVNCVIKAVLMNAARKLPYWHKGAVTEEDDLFAPLDRLQGAGALDAARALAQFTAGKQSPGMVEPLGWDSRPIVPNNTFYYYFDATDPNARLTATMTWNRHYEDRYPFRLRTEQSDLRLELWGIDPNAPDEMVLLDVSDSPVDTVEHLWTPLSQAFTRYAVAVRFSPDAALTAPPFERFALAWSVSPDTSAGHPLWDDLNADGSVDHLDRFIRLFVESDRLQSLQPAFYEQAMGLTADRADLLTALWNRWKPYLAADLNVVTNP